MIFSERQEQPCSLVKVYDDLFLPKQTPSYASFEDSINLLWLTSLRGKIPDWIKFEIQKKKNEGIHTLCPTRWTVRGDALAAFIENYTELMDLWFWSLQAYSDTEMKARLQGDKTVMSTFQFLAVPVVK